MTDPKDPQAELREAIRHELIDYAHGQIISGKPIDRHIEHILALFQAHQQQLVDTQTSELLKIERSLERTQRIEAIDRAVTEAQQQLLTELLAQRSDTFLAPTYGVPVEVIKQKLQQTNDGGSGE